MTGDTLPTLPTAGLYPYLLPPDHVSLHGTQHLILVPSPFSLFRRLGDGPEVERADGRCRLEGAELSRRDDSPLRISRAVRRPLNEARIKADVGGREGRSLQPAWMMVVIVVVMWRRGLVGVWWW